MKKYLVELTAQERTELQGIIGADRMAAHKRRHAQMLLKADQGEHGPGWTDARVAEAFDVTPLSVERLRLGPGCGAAGGAAQTEHCHPRAESTEWR